MIFSEKEAAAFVTREVGLTEKWEDEKISYCYGDVWKICLSLGFVQTSLSRSMLWFRAGAKAGCPNARLAVAALTYAQAGDASHKKDEAAYVLRPALFSPKVLPLLAQYRYPRDLDLIRSRPPRYGGGASRFLTRTLLSGSLERNSGSALHRTFFSSKMREVQLIPLIGQYLVEDITQINPLVVVGSEDEEKEENLEQPKREPGNDVIISALVRISLLLFTDCSSINSLIVYLERDNEYSSFLPMLSKKLKPSFSPSSLRFGKNGYYQNPIIDLSFLPLWDTQNLSTISIVWCSVVSLAPLSSCSFPSLTELHLGRDPRHFISKLATLDGLNMHNTAELRVLHVCCSDLVDISALSGCSLSNLVCLFIGSASHPLDLSHLANCDFSSLETLSLDSSNVSDLSPLCEWRNFAPKSLSFCGCPVSDFSAFIRLDLSRISSPISFVQTHVSDLSELRKVPWSGLVVDVSQTPLGKSLFDASKRSPYSVGVVSVVWTP